MPYNYITNWCDEVTDVIFFFACIVCNKFSHKLIHCFNWFQPILHSASWNSAKYHPGWHVAISIHKLLLVHAVVCSGVGNTNIVRQNALVSHHFSNLFQQTLFFSTFSTMVALVSVLFIVFFLFFSFIQCHWCCCFCQIF